MRLPWWFQTISLHFYCVYSIWPNNVFKCGYEMNACFVIHWKPAKLSIMLRFIIYFLSNLYLYCLFPPANCWFLLLQPLFCATFQKMSSIKWNLQFMILKHTEYSNILSSRFYAYGKVNYQYYFNRQKKQFNVSLFAIVLQLYCFALWHPVQTTFWYHRQWHKRGQNRREAWSSFFQEVTLKLHNSVLIDLRNEILKQLFTKVI